MNGAKKGARTSKKKSASKSGSPNADNAITGNMGLHYTCMRLSALGLNAISTARNTVGVDVFVNNRDSTGKTVSVQVKTVSGRYHVPLGKHGKPILGDFWVVVANAKKICVGEEPLCFVIEGSKIKAGCAGSMNFRFLNLSKFHAGFVDAWEKIEAAIDRKSARKHQMKARANSAVSKILGQSDDESSVFVRSRDALLVYFAYAKGMTFRTVFSMKAREIAKISPMPQHIKDAANEVKKRHGKGSYLICQNNGKPYRRWEVLAGMGSSLKRRWMGG